MDYKEIEHQLYDRWPEFIRSVTGYEIPNLKGRGHPCPRCGGNDRAHFRIKNGRAVLFCRGACGTADSPYGANTMTPPEHLVMDMAGLSFAELVNVAAEYVGIMPQREKPRQQAKPFVRKELAALTSAAVPIEPWDSYVAGRFMVQLESLLEIGGIESVPLFDAKTLQVDAYLQIDLRGRQRIIGNSNHDRLMCMIGAKQFGPDGMSVLPVYCTSFTLACVLNQVKGWQVFYSPAAKLWQPGAFSGVMLSAGSYEVLERASLRFGDTRYYYPADPDTFEFTKGLKTITLDKINAFLNAAEMAS